jgi:uncharacterized tellurite resistance protein B-like protein
MLSALKAFFDQHLASEQKDEALRVRLACAALLTEVARLDEGVSEAERARVIDSIQARFALPQAEAAELERLGREEARQATDYFQFTSLINRSFSAAQKIELIEHLWQVAYADARLNKYEEHLVRKVADLLYVSHAHFITAKHRARDAVGPDK